MVRLKLTKIILHKTYILYNLHTTIKFYNIYYIYIIYIYINMLNTFIL